jgi:hypothetical protein
MDASEVAVDFILTKYGMKDYTGRMPIELPIVREDLSVLFNELGYKIGAEIGVERAMFSEALCRNNPGVKHFCIDMWQTYRGYRDHVNQQKLDRFMAESIERMKPYNAEFIKAFSLDAVKNFKDNSLDYVYIDGNHDFQNCCNDIVEWGKKVRSGGIISGHDFDKHRGGGSFIHVHECVYGYTAAYKIKPWFKTKNQPHNAASFLWVKK